MKSWRERPARCRCPPHSDRFVHERGDTLTRSRPLHWACAHTVSSCCMRWTCLEIVGTGGDGANSFNISTTSALVIAAAGVPVAKHGNRAASSKCGAADVLEALGVNIALTPEKSAALLKKINICFLFAQNYHFAMKYVAPIRKELGIRTVFNILGPLSNPAGANMELMGVYEEEPGGTAGTGHG